MLGTIFGGFDLDKPVVSITSLSLSGGYVDGAYIAQILVTAMVVYINIVCYTVFFAALFRNIGPCIPVVIIVLMMLSLGGSIVSMIGELLENDGLVKAVMILDPLFVISGGGLDTSIVVKDDVTKSVMYVKTDAFVSTIINNLVYSGIFFAGGALIFAKRDVK